MAEDKYGTKEKKRKKKNQENKQMDAGGKNVKAKGQRKRNNC